MPSNAERLQMVDPLVITVNGQKHTVESPPETPLLYVLRDEMGLNGPQFGCGSETCKACTVLLGTRDVQSCKLPVSEATKGAITTLEGLQAEGELHPIQRAFIDEQASQCGYCINGMVMTTAAFLYRNRRPSDADIRHVLDGNLCRCGAHTRILRAVRRAADYLAAEGM
jgi:nicotinate dehydrogenase subunit A